MITSHKPEISALLERLLNPDDLGLATSAELRDVVRFALGRPATETNLVAFFPSSSPEHRHAMRMVWRNNGWTLTDRDRVILQSRPKTPQTDVNFSDLAAARASNFGERAQVFVVSNPGRENSWHYTPVATISDEFNASEAATIEEAALECDRIEAGMENMRLMHLDKYGYATDAGVAFGNKALGANHCAVAIRSLASTLTPDRHSDDVAIDEFATALKAKMADARAKGRSGWEECYPADLSMMLREHVEKGDPRDVANFCMMLWQHEAPISAQAPVSEKGAWQPIETAPNSEETPFLVLTPFYNGHNECVVQVSRFEGNLYPDGLDCVIDFDDRITAATHWMPLPQAPCAQSQPAQKDGTAKIGTGLALKTTRQRRQK